jgi:hypothetical protein
MSADKRDQERIVTRAQAVLLFDEHHAVCMVRDLSGSGAQVITPERPAVGSTVVLFVDDFGRFEARVARHTAIGVALRFQHRPGRLERTLERIADLVGRLTAAGGLAQGANSSRVLLEALAIAGEIAGSRSPPNRNFWQVVDRCAERGWVTVRPAGAEFWVVEITDAGRQALG